MELLGEIVRVPWMHQSDSILEREAVRGIIFQQSNLLMIHSSKNGEFKFPGGGIQANENHHQTLVREIREECGALVIQIGEPFGMVIEYDPPFESTYDVFKMTSYYYFCQVNSQFIEQELDLYEYDLGFQPRWVNLDSALQNNLKISKALTGTAPKNKLNEIRWLAREIFVLQQFKTYLQNNLT